MCGEDGPVLDGRDGVGELVAIDAGLAGTLERVEQLAGAFGLEPELLDAVHLLRHVGEVEVDGERPDEQDGVDLADLGDDLRELFAGGRIAFPGAPGQRANELDECEELRPHVALDRVAELGTQASDVGPEEFFTIFCTAHAVSLGTRPPRPLAVSQRVMCFRHSICTRTPRVEAIVRICGSDHASATVPVTMEGWPQT